MKQFDFPQIPLKRRMLYLLHSFLHLSKLDMILAHSINIHGAVILMYHSIVSNENKKWIDPSNNIDVEIFEKHMKFLAKKRNVISLDNLIISLRKNISLPAGTTVITFDDGYLDNLTIAAPILRKYNLPATIYLATKYIGREENQWIDQLYSYFNERRKERLLIPEIFDKEMNLKDSKLAWKVYSQISNYLIISSYKKRSSVLNCIKKQLSPKNLPPKLTMNWNDVRTLINNNKNITLGSHTANHIDITGIKDKKILSEIQISTKDIERETGIRPVHFSCPYSRTCCQLPNILIELGYISSVSDNSDLLINSNSSPFTLGRVHVPLNLYRLAHYTSGIYPYLSKKLTGRY